MVLENKKTPESSALSSPTASSKSSTLANSKKTSSPSSLTTATTISSISKSLVAQRLESLNQEEQLFAMNKEQGLAGLNNSVPVNNGSGAFVEELPMPEGIELTTFFEHLKKRLHSQLDYPQDFADNRLAGSVTLDFYVDPKGRLLGDFVEVSGESPLLKLYSMSLVYAVLKKELPRNVWATQDKIPVRLVIHYKINLLTDMVVTNEINSQNNHIIATQIRRGTPKLVEQIDTLFTHYIPPIIPIPGGFYVDLIKLAEYAYNIKNGVPTKEEARQRRLKLTQEQLESSLRHRN